MSRRDLAAALPDAFGPDLAGSLNNLLPIYQKYLLCWGWSEPRKPIGLPLLGDAVICYYRQDLWQKLRKLTAPEPAPNRVARDRSGARSADARHRTEGRS